MNDLVERLRGRNEYHQHAPLYNEAAEEIERLRIEIAQGNAAWKEVHIGCEAEIARLTAALSVAGLWRDMGEENKRLKAALRDALTAWQEGRNLNEPQILAALEGK